jgi:hypothetical protein
MNGRKNSKDSGDILDKLSDNQILINISAP